MFFTLNTAAQSRFQADGKTTKSALAEALKAAADRDLEPRSKSCIRRAFLKKCSKLIDTLTSQLLKGLIKNYTHCAHRFH